MRILLWILLTLLLTNRLPAYLSFFALAILLLLWIIRKIATDPFAVSTPLTLPVLLLLIPSLRISVKVATETTGKFPPKYAGGV